MTGLFGDVCVLDASRGIAGSFCARLLGDFGADVLKLEPPQGEEGRALAPFAGDDPQLEKSLFFTLLNVNKRGSTLNLETVLGREIFMRLAREADVVVESFAPGYLDHLGIGWRELHKVNPRLTLTSVTPYGQTGPYADYVAEEINLYAIAGVMSYSGSPDREPLKHGGFQAHYEGGVNAAAATAVALFARERSGAGEHIDISIHQCVASTAVMAQACYSFSGGIIGRRKLGVGPFNSVVPCKDGHVVLGVPNEAAYRTMAEVLDAPAMLAQPLGDPASRRAHVEELDRVVLTALQRKTKQELFLDPRKPLVGIVQTPQDLVDCRHLASRGFYTSIHQPGIGTLMIPAALLNPSLTPPDLRLPAPQLGEHNREVYGTLGFSGEDLAAMRETGII